MRTFRTREPQQPEKKNLLILNVRVASPCTQNPRRFMRSRLKTNHNYETHECGDKNEVRLREGQEGDEIWPMLEWMFGRRVANTKNRSGTTENSRLLPYTSIIVD